MRQKVFHQCGITFAILALCIVGCDTYPEDDVVGPPTETTDYYTLPNSIVLIDLSRLADQLFKVATLTVSSTPTRGQLVPVDQRLLKYQPDWDFRDGEDSFVVTAKNNADVIGKFTLRILVSTTTSTFPCEFIPIGNVVNVNGPGSVSIPVLDNDYLCDTSKGTLEVSIYAQPSQGSASVNGQSIHYSSDQRLQSNDALIYEVRSADGNSWFGWVSLAEETIEIFATPDKYTRGELVFVNGQTGFYSGSAAIYKTKDGGVSWSKIYTIGEGAEIIDLQFLNAKEGMALYTPCNYGLWTTEYISWMDCGAILLKTTDGGEHWEKIDINSLFRKFGNIGFGTSVFFTSPDTGYLGVTLLDGMEFTHAILTTDNGGKSWRKVFTDDLQNAGELKISFTDARTGYAYLAGNPSQDNLLITQDGGENWTTVISTQEIAAIAATSDGLYTSLATDHRYGQPSTLVKFQNGSSSGMELAQAPYKISRLGFSPSGTLGFAGGTTREVSLGLYKSTDGGMTWRSEDIDVIYGGGVESQRETNMLAITVPTEDRAYILYGRKIIRYTN